MIRTLLLVFVLTLLLTGCGRGGTSGLTSVNDYAYAVGSPAQAQEVARRFEWALDCLRKNGLEDRPEHDAREHIGNRQVRLQGKGVEAELTLVLPDQGFATINLTFRYEVRDPSLRMQADRLLAKLGDVLTPGRPVPSAGAGPTAKRPSVTSTAARV